MTHDVHDGAGRPALGSLSTGMIEDYLQPMAQHVAHLERLLLRGADGRWYLWTGEEPDAPPVEIPAATATWMLVGPALRLLPGPRVWIHRADLPLLPHDAWHGQPGRSADDAAAG